MKHQVFLNESVMYIPAKRKFSESVMCSGIVKVRRYWQDTGPTNFLQSNAQLFAILHHHDVL